MIKGFKDFIMRGNVVDLAVAVVIGAAFGAIVTSLVDNIVNPLIAAIFGQPDLSNVLAITLNDAGTADPADDAVLAIGAFLTAVINFLIIAAAIYFAVVLPLNKLAAHKKKDEPAPDEPVAPTEIELLTEIRDALTKKD
ncbi:large conductance mechanosensitive channel protein MscL [Demequina zhanjiangensis]|uniref:Large-conductance mechanosensitive channel n=1 Tax=Demequina zhanjiangensis TaxID=3051659 RepID=A0ABT8G5I9_9MICO|nr:large conductance mechanosensitive channel protein MscL [Demequina sp. SYSU T00b26]MDN4474204.1 large conductance mechanosensitive channel protein MscL [Demequina sp. SYSU T00b26]